MTNKNNKNFGKWGELVAEDFVVRNGLKIIARNFRTPYGELDLIAQQRDETVFIEVKTRSSNLYGFPEDAVTEIKRNHLLDAAAFFLMEHPEMNGDWRIDIIAIQTKSKDRSNPEITWFENAIS